MLLLVVRMNFDKLQAQPKTTSNWCKLWIPNNLIYVSSSITGEDSSITDTSHALHKTLIQNPNCLTKKHLKNIYSISWVIFFWMEADIRCFVLFQFRFKSNVIIWCIVNFYSPFLSHDSSEVLTSIVACSRNRKKIKFD